MFLLVCFCSSLELKGLDCQPDLWVKLAAPELESASADTNFFPVPAFTRWIGTRHLWAFYVLLKHPWCQGPWCAVAGICQSWAAAYCRAVQLVSDKPGQPQFSSACCLSCFLPSHNTKAYLLSGSGTNGYKGVKVLSRSWTDVLYYA